MSSPRFIRSYLYCKNCRCLITLEEWGDPVLSEELNLVELAKTELDCEHMSSAREYAKQVLEINPSNGDAWFIMLKTVEVRDDGIKELVPYGEKTARFNEDKPDIYSEYACYLGQYVFMKRSEALELMKNQQNGYWLYILTKGNVLEFNKYLSKMDLNSSSTWYLERLASDWNSFVNTVLYTQLKKEEKEEVCKDGKEYYDWLYSLISKANPEDRTEKEIPEFSATKYHSSGCYVATAVYGSYDCPQVWTLRRFRDNTLAKSMYGRAFVHTYYALSPTLVNMFGDTAWFRAMWKKPLDTLVKRLQDNGVENTPYKDKTW